jgi:hypothetical protein
MVRSTAWRCRRYYPDVGNSTADGQAMHYLSEGRRMNRVPGRLRVLLSYEAAAGLADAKYGGLCNQIYSHVGMLAVGLHMGAEVVRRRLNPDPDPDPHPGAGADAHPDPDHDSCRNLDPDPSPRNLSGAAGRCPPRRTRLSGQLLGRRGGAGARAAAHAV